MSEDTKAQRITITFPRVERSYEIYSGDKIREIIKRFDIDKIPETELAELLNRNASSYFITSAMLRKPKSAERKAADKYINNLILSAQTLIKEVPRLYDWPNEQGRKADKPENLSAVLTARVMLTNFFVNENLQHFHMPTETGRNLIPLLENLIAELKPGLTASSPQQRGRKIDHALRVWTTEIVRIWCDILGQSFGYHFEGDGSPNNSPLVLFAFKCLHPIHPTATEATAVTPLREIAPQRNSG